ncbi:MAG: tRNA 2-thiouridine(34) synthase MnmA, partial [Bacteroidota bacterium]
PDVLCNREIKFDIFLDKALKLNADYVATGHYVQRDTVDQNGQLIHRLISGADPNKDQSYFLCQLNQWQLSKALFPIGNLQKSEVRHIAEEIGLPTAHKKDSQGLCFIGKVKLPTFLQQQLKPKQGDIVEIPSHAPVYAEPIMAGNDAPSPQAERRSLTRSYQYAPDMGQVVGPHQGAHYFTIGQRKGLNVGGKAEPLFVIGTDTETNTVYVGMGEHHPGLNRPGLFIPAEDVHWVRPDLALSIGEGKRYQARIRYRQDLQEVHIFSASEGLYLVFDELQRGITPGQFAAWYQAGELIGSGVIA